MGLHPNLALIHARKQHAWSQEEVAGKLGTTQANLSRWERGITSPTPYYLRKLSELYQKSPEELFPDTFEQSVTPADQDVPSSSANMIFWYNRALTDPRECYGREREKLRLLNCARQGISASIVGPYRIGKTWLLHYLRLVASKELGSQFIVGYVDAMAPNCATLSGFTNELLQALGIPLPSSDESSTDLTALWTGVKELIKNNCFPILCIDEFERLRKVPGFDLDFLEHLRSIAQEGLRLVLASKHPLTAITLSDGQVSPFFNIFMQIGLKPFSLQEARAFVEAKGQEATFTEEERGRLLKYAEQNNVCPPLRLQLAGTLLQEDKSLAAQHPDLYQPDDPAYWQEFEERVEEAYEAVVRDGK